MYLRRKSAVGRAVFQAGRGKRMKKVKRAAQVLSIMFSAVFCLAGCAPAGDQNREDPPEQNTQYALQFEQQEYTLAMGESKDFGITFIVDGAAADPSLLKVTSSDESVVTVQNGTLTAVSAGNAVIMAEAEELSAWANVTVVANATAEQVNGFGEEYINIYGRSYITDGKLNLDQSANAVEVGISGGGLSVEISATAFGYLRVWVDGEEAADRIKVTAGSAKYTVAEDLPQGFHKIRLVKATEMQTACWDILFFEAENFVCMPEKSDLKIEFVGDSISAGYGVLATAGESWSVDNSDCTRSYTYVTADKLNADYSIVAWSGICTKAYHWASNINMADLYKRVSFTNTAEYAFDFSPDVVVINLGTNESSYLSGHPDYAQQFPSDYKDFLTYVRQKNPDAYIICLYGMMGKNATISNGIETACKQMNDEKVLYNPFNIIANTSAANGHPSAAAQENWGELLSQYIFSILGTSDLTKQ